MALTTTSPCDKNSEKRLKPDAKCSLPGDDLEKLKNKIQIILKQNGFDTVKESQTHQLINTI